VRQIGKASGAWLAGYIYKSMTAGKVHDYKEFDFG
jgi:hypothetical protein